MVSYFPLALFLSFYIEPTAYIPAIHLPTRLSILSFSLSPRSGWSAQSSPLVRNGLILRLGTPSGSGSSQAGTFLLASSGVGPASG